MTLSNQDTLNIMSLDPYKDYGTYTCTASSALGAESKTVQLNVYRKLRNDKVITLRYMNPLIREITHYFFLQSTLKQLTTQPITRCSSVRTSCSSANSMVIQSLQSRGITLRKMARKLKSQTELSVFLRDPSYNCRLSGCRTKGSMCARQTTGQRQCHNTPTW